MLTIDHLNVHYQVSGGIFHAAKDVTLSVKNGEFFTLLGPSGCGKTTTLRSVAGLERPSDGRIVIGDQVVYDSGRKLLKPAQDRNIAMVFQSYAVWPHMTVGQNVGFPLEAARVNRTAIRSRVLKALEMVGLEDFADRPATLLSGGQQQRVALARALVRNADLVLLDEPLSNLDAKLREQMRSELRQLQENLGQTTVYVTHDQEEALSLSDRIAFMKDGKLVEIGTPQSLYLAPSHLETARFLGQAEFFPCHSIAPAGQGNVAAETDIGTVIVENSEISAEGCVLMIRPEHIEIVSAAETARPNLFDGKVIRVEFAGKSVQYDVALHARTIQLQAPSVRLHVQGEAVKICLAPNRCVLLDDKLGT